MINKRLSQLGIYSLVSKSLKVLIAPIVLFFISSSLSLESMGFYFTFLSLIAAQQLLEAGIGHTLKQFIAHAYVIDEQGKLTLSSKKHIKSYILFAVKWFIILALLFAGIIGWGGLIYFSDYKGDVSWKYPWLCLVLTSSMAVATAVIPVIFEATQNQLSLYRAQTLAGMISSLATVVSLYNGLHLYSISVGVLCNTLCLVLLQLKQLRVLFSTLSEVHSNKNFKEVLFEIIPLLSKVSVIWFFGFFFWNSFNLIAFKVSSAEFAGILGFSLAMARAGFNMSESIISGQMTRYSFMIKNGELLQAIKAFKVFKFISLSLLIFGYSLFLILNLYNTEFYLVNIYSKSLPLIEMAQLLIFFTITFLLTVQSNFIRCFKIEPFVTVSIIRSIIIPIFFYYLLENTPIYIFSTLSFIMIIFYLWVSRISGKVLSKELNSQGS